MKKWLMRTFLMAFAFMMTVPALAWAEEAAEAVMETAAAVDSGDTA